MELLEYYTSNKLFHTPFNKDKEYKFLYKRSKETVFRVMSLPKPKLSYLDLGLQTVIVRKTEAVEKNYIRIYSKFRQLLKSKKDYFHGYSESTVLFYFKKVFLKLIAIEASGIKFDVTEDCSIFFQSKISGDNAYLELYFDDELPDLTELIVNVYKPESSVSAYGGNIDEVFIKIENEMSQKIVQNTCVEPTFLPDEGLSTGSFATATF